VLGSWALYQLSPAIREWKSAREASPPVALSSPSSTPAFTPAPIAARPPGVDAATSDNPLLFVLAATVPGRNAREGVASLGTSLDSAQTYAAGGVLANGSRLAEIYTDHVVLERNGLRVAVYLHNTQPARIEGDSRLSARMNAEQSVLAVGGRARETPEQRAPALPALVAVIRSQPLFVNGVLKGIQVDPGSQAAKFAALGFKSGDLVVAIDGARVEQAEQIEDLMAAIGSGGPVAVTVERNGNLEHLNVVPSSGG
jgi:general secretion pathway protein C